MSEVNNTNNRFEWKPGDLVPVDTPEQRKLEAEAREALDKLHALGQDPQK